MKGRICLAIVVLLGVALPFWLKAPTTQGPVRRLAETTDQSPDSECVLAQTASVPDKADYFPDVTDRLNVDFVHVVGPLGTYFVPEINGAGGALFDFDGDGDLDLFFVSSGLSPAAQNESPIATQPGNRLYRQEGDGTFTDVTAGSGLEGGGYGVGCAIGDIDNDGDLDLYVTDLGCDRLYRNDGNGKFCEISRAAGILDDDYGTCAAFVDYDRDGWLDLVVVNYVRDEQYGLSVACGSVGGRNSYCGPHKFSKTVDRLYHNEGRTRDGQSDSEIWFRDVTESMGLAGAPTAGFGVVCADFNGDGWPDFYVANDMAPKRMWINQAGRFFADEAALRGVAVSGQGLAQGSMGVALGDVDGDGALDIVVTNLFNEATVLYVNSGAGVFSDGTRRAVFREPTLRHTGWGVALADFDLDGDLDLAQVNGLVVPCHAGFPPHGEDTFRVVHETIVDPGAYWREYGDNNVLLFNNGKGQFVDESRRAGEFTLAGTSGRALIWGDIDNDGDIDLVVTNCGGRARIYRNDVKRSGHWLGVRAVDPRLGRDAFGALVTVVCAGRRFGRLIDPASSYLAANDVRAHFGLGNCDRFDEIVVLWPDGLREHFPAGAADRFLQLNRGEGLPSPEENEP